MYVRFADIIMMTKMSMNIIMTMTENVAADMIMSTNIIMTMMKTKMNMNINEAGKNETMIPMDGNAGDGVREILLLQKMTVFIHLSIFHNKRHGPPLLS